MEQAALRFVVRGRVQGVGFRVFVAQQAHQLGVRGYARNQPDGSVEVVAVGSGPALDELAFDLQQGPRAARVTSLQSMPIAPVPDFADFVIR